MNAAAPNARRWKIALVLVAAVWAGLMSWGYRYDRAAGRYTYLKFDFVAFYTAARMTADGNISALYQFGEERVPIELERAAGVPSFAPRQIDIIRIIPGKEFADAAVERGFPDPHPPVFVYAPVYTVAFMPLLPLDWFRAALVVDFISLLAFMGTVLLFWEGVSAEASPQTRLFSLFGIIACSTFAWPVRFDLLCGQISPLIAAALLAALYQPRRIPAKIALGAFVGLIAGIKMFPLLIIVWFLFSHRRVEAISAIASAALLFLLSLILFGSVLSQWRSIAAAMNEGTRVWTSNQSIEALLGRFLLPLKFTGDWVAYTPATMRIPAAILSTCAVGWWIYCSRVAFKKQSGDTLRFPIPHAPFPAISLSALLTLLTFATPLSWSHYGEYAFPGLVVLIFGKHGRAPLLRVVGIALALIIASNPTWAGVALPTLRNLLGDGAASVIMRVLFGLPTLAAVALFVILCAAMLHPPRVATLAE